MTLKDPVLAEPDKTWITVVVPVGALGAGVRADLLEQALAAGADAIALDAGSTDSGPAYLATGKSKYSRDSLKADLSVLIAARARWNVPLLIGSCGTSGCGWGCCWRCWPGPWGRCWPKARPT